MSKPVASKKSYFELAKEAIAALKERGGSSNPAIKAYIVSNNPSINFGQHLLRAALKKGAESGKLVKVKASFKLAESVKTSPKKVAAKKAAAPKAAAAKKVTAPKAAAVKKSPAAKKGQKRIHFKK
jgi:histone H1/5